MTKTMTYVEALTIAIASMEDGEAKEKLKALKATYEKKAGKVSKAELAKKKASKALTEQIAETMADGVGRTITEMIGAFDFLADLTTSKVTSLCKPLIEDGTLTKEKVKGKMVYSMPSEEVEE